MSSAGQVVGGVAGAVVGFFVGGPSGAVYGAQLGMMAGSAIDPPKGPSITGPRLDDLSVQTATYGAPLPRGYGTVCVSGNIFWLEGDQLKEWTTTEESGGKGGGGGSETTTYHYSATFAVGLMHVPAGATVSLRRLWVDTDLIYEAGSDNVESIIASNSGHGFLAGSRIWNEISTWWINALMTGQVWTFYDGSDDQLPNDRMQADKGAANVSAYPGLCYIVFEDLSLEKYSNTLLRAQVKAELVVSIPEVQSSVGADVSVPTLAGRYINPVYEAFDGEFVYSVYTNRSSWDGSDNHIVCERTHINGSASKTWDFLAIGGGSTVGVWIPEVVQSDSLAALVTSAEGFGSLRVRAQLVRNGGAVFTTGWLPNGTFDAGVDKCVIEGAVAWTATRSSSTTIQRITEFSVTKTAASYSVSGMALYGDYLFAVDASASSATALVVRKFSAGSLGLVETITVNGIDGRWARLQMISETEFYAFRSRANIYHITDGQLEKTIPDPFGFAVGATDCSQDQIWFGTSDLFGWCVLNQGVGGPRAGKLLIWSWLVDPTAAPLRDIVTNECALAGIDAGNLDLSALTNSDVRGFRVAQRGAVRNSLEPLQAAYPFDVAQSGYKIRFVSRGGASVASISEEDLAATDGAPGVLLPIAREMDSQLPFRVSVRYTDPDREYDIGEQAVERYEKDSLNERVIELPLSLTSGEAIQMADVLLAKDWTERVEFGPFSLPPIWRNLEPADVVTVSHRGQDYTLRLTRVEYMTDGRLVCSARLTSPASYTSSATAQSPLVIGQSLVPLAGSSRVVLLDIPRIDAVQDVSGISAVMYGFTTGWPGGVLVRSDDQGTTWQAVLGFNGKARIFSVAEGGSAANSYSVDHATVITVTPLHDTAALYSVTEDQLYAHTNLAAWGADGRWEIVAFKTVTDNTGTYTLKDFLRGLYGSEWATGLHSAGDTLAMLDTSTAGFIGLPTTAINSPRLWRAVTQGYAVSSAPDIQDTYEACNLKPLAPVDLNGSRDAATNDWTLQWTPRSRWPVEVFSGATQPLGETAEAYEIDIYDNTYGTLKRTLTGLTSATASYTIVQQIADFGVAQSTLYLDVYQISSVVGRGLKLRSSIYRTFSTDPYSTDVVALLHMNDAGLTDVKGHAVTLNGNVARSATQSKFGGYSAYFDGSGDYLNLASIDFAFGTGDFTVEAWVNPASVTNAGVWQLSTTAGGFATTNRGCVMAFNSGGGGLVVSYGATDSFVTATIPTNSWTHLAMSRAGTSLKVFVNGSLVATFTDTTNYTAQNLVIGGYYSSTYVLSGYIDEFRITKFARYVASFTPDTIQFPDP